MRVVRSEKRLAVWEGQVRPLNKFYQIRINFCLTRRLASKGVLPSIPHVTIIDPLLNTRKENPNDPIPHIYRNEFCPSQPILCLYDPQTDEWNTTKPIANTIIPWAIDWLVCYEIWHAIGEWTGGGRHTNSK